MMHDFPKFCPYCHHTELRVRVTAWALVINGELQVVESEEEITILDTEANTVCASCGGEFTWHPKSKT